MSAILDGLPGVLYHLDDILVFGKDSQEHNAHLEVVLERICAAGITLNRQKCEFGKTTLTFLGHVINQHGISPDSLKTAAIKEMPPPKTVSELRRFMGMINQLGKFSPNTAEISTPLRKLLSSNQVWQWGPDQEDSYKKLQIEITKPTVLKWYNVQAPTKISADASSYGIGAVLLQLVDTHWFPIAYASRVMTNTETRYAQIEKEALAITWACEKFSQQKNLIRNRSQAPCPPVHLQTLGQLATQSTQVPPSPNEI